jgi:hypothetical protein
MTVLYQRKGWNGKHSARTGRGAGHVLCENGLKITVTSHANVTSRTKPPRLVTWVHHDLNYGDVKFASTATLPFVIMDLLPPYAFKYWVSYSGVIRFFDWSDWFGQIRLVIRVIEWIRFRGS